MKKVAIIGSHGLYAKYGGWDQLVKNLAEMKSGKFNYIIFNSSDTPCVTESPRGVSVKKLFLKASGLQGIFYDFISICMSYFTSDTLLLLGVQGVPLIALFSVFKKINIVSNVGGVEWERPKFGFFSKCYLRFCFWLCFIFSEYVILDNEYFLKYVPTNSKAKVIIIPYGGCIDETLEISVSLKEKYPFLGESYFLSISRSLEDNCLDEICSCFSGVNKKLVLISNFTNSSYGLRILTKYRNHSNIYLINGLYEKDVLDLIRRSCAAYIHTHRLCGTAPSLVEMIVCGKPIISIDNPQNRYTLSGEGAFFSDFDQLNKILKNKTDYENLIPTKNLQLKYDWDNIVRAYEETYLLAK